MIKPTLPVASLIFFAVALPAHPAETATGQALFQVHCSRCHGAGPASLKTPPDLLAATLRDSRARQHRFQLSDAELEALAAFVAASKAGQ